LKTKSSSAQKQHSLSRSLINYKIDAYIMLLIANGELEMSENTPGE